MKRFTYLLVLMCALWACKKEPQFPDPGLDLTRDIRDTVRRDTIDTYRISMHIKAPNGVSQIQVLNGYTYDEIAIYTTEYAGKKDFIFTYDADLREVKKDSTLHFIVKVVDQNMRAYNKGFSLRVLNFSEPLITVGGVTADGRISLTNNYIMLKARFTTGMNTVSSYKMSLDGQVFDSHTYAEQMKVVLHKKGYVLDEMTEKDRDYVLKIEMTDNKGTTAVKEIVLRMMDLEKPIKVKMNSYNSSNSQSLTRELTFNYNGINPDRLDRIDGKYFTYNINGGITGTYLFKYEFIYNTSGMVKEFKMIWDIPASGRNNFSYVLTYDNMNRLTSWEGGLLTAPAEWTVTQWLEDGRVKKFQRGTSITEWSWTYEEGLFAEYDLVASSESNRVRATGVTTWAIPTFLSALPSIESYNTAFNSDILELLMYKNGFERLMKGTTEAGIYVYTADTKGRLQSMRRKASETSPVGREYIFEYAN